MSRAQVQVPARLVSSLEVKRRTGRLELILVDEHDLSLHLRPLPKYRVVIQVDSNDRRLGLAGA